MLKTTRTLLLKNLVPLFFALLFITTGALSLAAPLSKTQTKHCVIHYSEVYSRNKRSAPTPDSKKVKIIPLPKNESERPTYLKFLNERYGFKPEEITWGKKYPMIIRGGAVKTFFPAANLTQAVPVEGVFDSIVIGAGPAGLSAGIILQEAGKKTMIIEREAALGGVAAGGTRTGVRHARGGAYFTSVEGENQKIFGHLGLLPTKKHYPIAHPIDSYYWNGKYYDGLWESEEALAELPASFALFKYYLEYAVRKGWVTSQPMEKNAMSKHLDSMYMSEWVRTFPNEVEKLTRYSSKAREIFERFSKDPKVNRQDPMKDVLGLLDLYGRSALGDHTDKINALAFANFYSSELGQRYTGNYGSGTITDILEDRLNKISKYLKTETEASVAKIVNTKDGVEVFYVKQDGSTYVAKAKSVVFAAPLNVAPRVIEGFAQQAPKHFKVINELEHRHYIVINLHVEGHPWTKTYDLWIRDDKIYSQAEPTDLIDGRWVDFDGTHLPRQDDRGVITVYHPLPASALKDNIDDAYIAKITQESIEKAKGYLDPLLKPNEKINILAVEANRWPYSIHIVEKGHFQNRASVLGEPVGNVYFANNNIGVPAVEEGIFRGYHAAQDIINMLKQKEAIRAPESLPKTKKLPSPPPALNP